MANFLVKYGPSGSLPGTLDPNIMYVTTDKGVIYMHGHEWKSGVLGIVEVEPIFENNSVSLNLIDGEGNEVQTDPIIVGVDSDTATVTISADGDLEVEVVVSTATNNIIKATTAGLFAQVRPIYDATTGVLKLQYTANGTDWTDLPGNVNLPLESFLRNGAFVTDQDDWDDNWEVTYGPATIDEPSLVLSVETQASPVTYQNIVIPAAGLFLNYEFQTTNGTMTYTTSTTGSTVTITGNVKVSTTAGNMLTIDANGLFVAAGEFKYANTNSIELTTDAEENFIANLKINTTTPGNVSLSAASSAGLVANFEWGTF